MTNQAVVKLAEALSRATGYTWLVIEPYDVGVRLNLGGQRWGYQHHTRLMRLDVDPDGYVQQIAEDFTRKHQQDAMEETK